MSGSAAIAQVERPVGDPPDPRRRRARPGSTADMTDGLFGLSLMAGSANVIMQLARPGVGYGVVESKVDSGRADLHPFKRARTTIGYLAVVALGSDEERAAFKRAIDSAHRQVRSGPDSPVKYNAFDPQLQLWVAACLYKGSVDLYRMFYGEMDEEEAERGYQEAKIFGTALQVRPEMWPADRAAFDKYWQEQLETTSTSMTRSGSICTASRRSGCAVSPCPARCTNWWSSRCCSSPPASCRNGSAMRCTCPGARPSNDNSTR